MSRKYVGQINSNSFVYPNNNLAEYDVEIIHNINDNCVSGTITDLSVSSSTSSGITFTHNGTFLTNGAQLLLGSFSNPNYTFNYLSVHCQVPNQTYMNTWRVVDLMSTTTSTPSTYTGNTITGNVIVITPSMFGLSSFTSGTYYLEFRFIGQNCLSKVCSSIDITISAGPTPTPTPTVTVSATNGYVPPTSTPTPTPTVTKTSGYVAPTPTPTPTTSGSGLVRIDWFLGMAAGARVTVTNNVSTEILNETSTGGSSRSGTIYVPLSQLPYTVTGWWNSGSGNIVRYNICDLGNGGEYYSSGAIDIIVDSESVLVSPTPLYIGINVVGQDTTPPTCPI
jgi:hypothetical protein